MRNRLFAAAAIAALILPAACGQSKQNTTPENAVAEVTADTVWAHQTSDLPVDPAVRFGQLENGMRYAIMANDTPKNTAAIRMRIDAGSLSENDDQRGISHFLEHMAFNGSENVPEGEMIKILERLGLAFGPDTNAFTSFDQIQYQLDLPSTSDELIDTGLFLMRETASNLTLDADAIERERGVILSEERARNSVGLRQFVQQIAFLAPDARLADRLPIGTTDVIKTAPRERFVEIYQGSYRPEKTTLVVTGDFDPADIEARIKAKFADWTAVGEPLPEPDLGTVDPSRPMSADVFYDPDATTSVSISYVKRTTKKPDTADNRKTNLIGSLGNTILNRRIARLSRESGAPFVGGGIGQSIYNDIIETTTISMTTQPDKWDAALAVAEQEMRRAVQFGFTEAELAEQLANIRTSIENGAKRAGTRQTTGLAGQLINSIHDDSVFTTPQSALERYNSFADTITVADVEAAFREQFEGANPQLFLSTDTQDDGLKTALITAYNASAAVPIEANIETDSAAFAYADYGTAGEIVSDTVYAPLDIRQIVFANNVRLNLKKTAFEDNGVRVSLRVGGGSLEIPAEPDGLSTFATGTFSAGGLEAHSVDDLQSLLAGKSVSQGFGINTDAFGGFSRTTPDDLQLQLQVWAAYLVAPGYREEGEEQWAKVVNAIYETIDATPQGIMARDVNRLLHNGDKRWGLASKEDLLAHDYDDLKPLLSDALSKGAIEIGIVGDIDADAAIAAVASTFGALPDRRAEAKPFADARKVSFPPAGEHTFEHAGLADKAMVNIYWPTTDASDHKLSNTMDLLGAVMRLKLTAALREELGATYSPGVFTDMSSLYPGYGFIAASSEIDPKDIPVVIETIKATADGMANGSITADELQRARQPILENIEESLESNGTWIGLIDEAQSLPDDLTRFQADEAVYKAVTVADLTAAAKTYMAHDKALTVKVVSDKVE